MALSKRWKTSFSSLMTIGVTPQVRDSWRQTFSVVAQLMMSLSGRYLESDDSL